MYTFITVATTA